MIQETCSFLPTLNTYINKHMILSVVESLFDSRMVQSDETAPVDGSTARPRLNLTGLDVAGILLS